MDALLGEAALLGELGDRRIAVELLREDAPRAHHAAHLLRHVHRQADRAPLVGQRARDGLTDPPGGVRGELEAHGVVELLDRADEAEVPLLDQVEERHARLCVVPRDRHHEAEVALDQLALGRLVAEVLAPGQLTLLRRRQQATVADCADVELQRVAQFRRRLGLDLSLLFFGGLRRGVDLGGRRRVVVRQLREQLQVRLRRCRVVGPDIEQGLPFHLRSLSAGAASALSGTCLTRPDRLREMQSFREDPRPVTVQATKPASNSLREHPNGCRERSRVVREET